MLDKRKHRGPDRCRQKIIEEFLAVVPRSNVPGLQSSPYASKVFIRLKEVKQSEQAFGCQVPLIFKELQKQCAGRGHSGRVLFKCAGELGLPMQQFESPLQAFLYGAYDWRLVDLQSR